MIQCIYKATVAMPKGKLDPHEYIHEITTRDEITQEFDKRFIAATRKSFDAQTDGYNGEMFALFEHIEDAREAEAAMKTIAADFQIIVDVAIAREEADLAEEE